MPKPSLKNPFARRRSSGNVLDVESPSAETPHSSFRVIERPEKNKIVFDGSNRASQVPRPFSSPLQQLRGKSVDDLTYHTNGGSGGTTNSGSSDFYQSSSASGRYSSSSTLPSSVEHGEEEEELFAQKRAPPVAYNPAPTRFDEPLPAPPSFSARAQRAFSFGLRNKQQQDRPELAAPPAAPSDQPPLPPPPPPSHSPTRERALTTSSYASTAVPTRIDAKPDLGTSDFGGDFSVMFDSGSKSPVVGPHRTDSEPLFPPRTYTRQDSASSPTGFKNSRKDTGSPWERRTSRDGLLGSAATSPALASSSKFFTQPDGYAAVPVASTSPGRASEESQASSSKTYELRDSQDTSKLPLSKSVPAPALPRPAETPSTFAGENPWDEDSSSATPRAANRQSILHDEEPLFDASPIGPASRAKRPEVPQSKSESAAPRRLTKAQFELLQRHDKATDSGEGDSGNEYEDDDEVERAKQATKQRRKQEANMSVYRQQMKKVTGGGPADLPLRPGLDARSSSTPSLHVGGIPGTPPIDRFQPKQTDDDDEDIPLGILQAHGFPSSNRPPTRLDDSYRPPSVAAQRSSQNLPPFARRLPQDPYFGAGLVNPAARESLAFGSGGSVYGGGSPSPASPGGLVGIIANEEQQRQARRGSPNPITGTYNSMPLPSNMPMNRTSSMGTLQAPGYFPPSGGMPGMPGMPMMPQMPMTADPQLQEFMQMQMQFMQNMQAMLVQSQMQAQGPVPAVGIPRPMSSMGAPGDQNRAMSMLVPPAWNVGMASRPTSTFDPRMSTYAPSMSGLAGPGAGYQPSIAPSERSNVGMPTRYRPVQTEDGRTNSLTSSLTLNAFSSQQATERPVNQADGQRKSTIRIIDKPKSLPKLINRRTEHEEDEESWADMVKKKVRSKRSDRASRTGGDRVALSELYPNVE